MKLLAVSDIHGNVEAVRRLRAREANSFDGVVVAGDIGSKAAPAILHILASFACPVMYVYGNWDAQLPYDADFGPNCHHLHLRAVECGGWALAGFSGLPVQWGLNPIAAAMRQEVSQRHRTVVAALAEAKAAARSLRSRRHPTAAAALARVKKIEASRAYAAYATDLRKVARDILAANRRRLAAVIKTSSAGPQRTIVVTHERLYRVEADLASVPLFLFGHRHGFQSFSFKGAQFVNVSALDDWATVGPSGAGRSASKGLRNVKVGAYTVIELRRDRFTARSVRLAPRLTGWTVLEDKKVPGAPWLHDGDLPRVSAPSADH